MFSVLYNSGPSAGFCKGGCGGGGYGRGLWISVPRDGSMISGYRGCSENFWGARRENFGGILCGKIKIL